MRRLMGTTEGRLGLEHAPSPRFYLFCSCVHGENKETRKCQPRHASFSFPLPRIFRARGQMCSSQRGPEQWVAMNPGAGHTQGGPDFITCVAPGGPGDCVTSRRRPGKLQTCRSDRGALRLLCSPTASGDRFCRLVCPGVSS